MERASSLLALGLLLGLLGCPPRHPTAADAGPPTTKVIVSNLTDAGASVAISIGADSVVEPSEWSFCVPPAAGPSCAFTLAPSSMQALPTGGRYLNVSIAFNGPVGCGSTIAEVTANSANGFGTADVSLVNGWNANVQIQANSQTLGPALDAGNADTLGVFPYACDICVAREGPPCGIPAAGCTDSGSCGCKFGTQYDPSVPCQVTYQTADAGSLVNVQLVP